MSPDPSQLSTINMLIGKLSQAQSVLQTAADATADPTKLGQINDEHDAIQSCMDQAAQAQAAANDALFKQAISVLKNQGQQLEDTEKQIGKIISDVKLAGEIAGYIAEAIILVAKL